MRKLCVWLRIIQGQEGFVSRIVTCCLSRYLTMLVSEIHICITRHCSVQFTSVTQPCPTLCDPMNRSSQAFLSITNSGSSPRLRSIESVIPSSCLILCRLLLLLSPIPPSIRVFSNESTLCLRWPKYWSFSFSIIPSKEIPGLISLNQLLIVTVFFFPLFHLLASPFYQSPRLESWGSHGFL